MRMLSRTRIRNDTYSLVENHGMAEYFDPLEGTGLGGMDFLGPLQYTSTYVMVKLPKFLARQSRIDMMAAVQLKNVEKWFDNLQVIKGIDLAIKDGEFIVLVGPSGCGKSTLLRILAGLEDTSIGEVIIDGEDVTDQLPSERGLSMVFQSYALYPHMTVAENIGFSLKNSGVSKEEVTAKVEQVSHILKLETLADRLPKQLSGGQRQRVAIGRAIVREPKGFLLMSRCLISMQPCV